MLRKQKIASFFITKYFMKFICLGSSCDAHLFIKKIDEKLKTNFRFKGPVDNLAAESFMNVDKLLNGDFFNSVVTGNSTIIGDRFIFDGYVMVHNDWSSDETKEEMIHRILSFKEHYKDNDVYYLYSTGPLDYLTKEKNIKYILDKYPFLKDRIIIIYSKIYQASEVLLNSFPVININPYNYSEQELDEAIEKLKSYIPELI